MEITLEQARALDALARLGSFKDAAREVKRGHTGVLYLLKTMEDRLGLKLLDRTQYRTQLTPKGRLVWAECAKLLQAERAVLRLCADFSEQWEPELKMVFDGIIPPEASIRVLRDLEKHSPPTRISLYSEFLSGVEEKFDSEHADLMVSVLPIRHPSLERVDLAPIKTLLVAHRNHPLVTGKRKMNKTDLSKHILLTVRGSDQRLLLSTEQLNAFSTVHLSDFQSKKAAILQGLGYGWLPTTWIENELKAKKLAVIRWDGASEQMHYPLLFHRGEHRLGRAGRFFLSEFVKGNGLK